MSEATVQEKTFKDFPQKEQEAVMRDNPFAIIIFDDPPRELQKASTEADIRTLELIDKLDPILSMVHKV